MKKALFVFSLVLSLAVQSAWAAPGEVLILANSVTGGLGSREAQAVVAAGKTPVMATDTFWRSLTAAQFMAYDGLVLGDATCSTDLGGCVAAAIDTAMVWGPVVNGNVIIIGSDPVYHSGWIPGARTLITQGIAFAFNKASKLGAYIDLSCYYHFAGANTPVSVLDGLNGGGFNVTGGSYLPGLNDVKIVATHPAIAGLTDADLSNWGNSVHEAFNTWPAAFDVLAIARDSGGAYTASDGTRGYPYILARGEELVLLSDITLTPKTAVNPIGTTHTVVATVKENTVPVAGKTVQFQVVAGPHLGASGTGVTDNNGQAVFTYLGTAVGTDTIEASFVDSLGRRQFNRATKQWVSPPVITAALAGNRAYYLLTASSSTYSPAQLQVYVKDSGSAFVAGPYPSGTIVRMVRGVPGTGPGLGTAAVTIRVAGYGLAYAIDPVAQSSATVPCRP
jgi:hypothetical protein